MADDSGILLGGDYGRANANSHYAEFNLIIHDTGVGVTKIELYTNGGSGWYGPPTDGSDTCYVDPTDNLIEAKVARQDLGLNGDRVDRFHFAFCKNAEPPVWANGNDSTYTYGTCDAVDSISIPKRQTNDKYNDRSSWAEDISDGDIDFWVELKISEKGIISNSIPASSSLPTPTNNATNISLTPTLSWAKVTDQDDLVTSYLVELSSVTNLNTTVLYRVNVTNTNYSITEALPDGLPFFWRVRARDRRGVLSTNATVWQFTTVETQQVPAPTTAPFTPYIDGLKDTSWGTNPYILSSQSNQPYNFAEDLYVSNDPDYLYIGWKMYRDPWDESAGGYDKSAHWGFVFEGKNDPFGNENDPFIGSGTKVSWPFKPDIWVMGWLKSDFSAFGKLIKYIWNESSLSLDETTMEENKEYSIETNSWGEFRIPLTELGAELGDKVNMVWFFRPADDKNGVSDSVPYDSSCNDFGDSDSTLTSKSPYRIQYALVNTWHYPGTEEVTGLGKMRSPVAPSSSQKAVITIGVYPYNGYDTSLIYYTTNNWATTNTVVLESFHRSANNMYLKAEVGPFNKDTLVKYFTSVTRNSMTTYNYGTDESSTVTSNISTARINAFEFLINNSAPSKPTVAISPLYVFTNDIITLDVTTATDIDNDPLECYFQWYKNSVWQSNLDSVDAAAPFQAAVSNFISSDRITCKVRLFDNLSFSEEAVSSEVAVLLNKWKENVVLLTNSSIFTDNEFIWRDRLDDVRKDISLLDRENYDITEVHIKTDPEYLYFLFRFDQIITSYRIGLALSINTNQNGSDPSIGDEMNLTLGSNYSGTISERLADINLLFHSFMIGTGGVEIKRASDASWTPLASTNGAFMLYEKAGFAEARIKRSLLNLTGNKKARISVIAYQDKVGLANDVDSSIDFSGNDGLDPVSAGISRGTNVINYADTISSFEEELSDNDLDFWFDLILEPAGALTNTPPPVIFGFNPAHNGVISDLTPTLSWTASPDPDVTGYYLELGLSTNSSVYQVNVGTDQFIVPENLVYGYTNYYWRVYARDTSGTLSSFASNIRFTVDVSAPIANQVMDNMNLDNYGQVSGLADADGDVVFNWAPSIDQSGIANYFICIGTSPGGVDVTNDLSLPGNTTMYTASSLTKGQFYYAKVKARNTSSVTGEYGLSSDGIYVSRIKVH